MLSAYRFLRYGGYTERASLILVDDRSAIKPLWEDPYAKIYEFVLYGSLVADRQSNRSHVHAKARMAVMAALTNNQPSITILPSF